MRASLTLALGVAVSLAIPFAVGPAHADPAYSANKVIDFFTQQKAGDAALNAKTRSVCLGTASDCHKQGSEPASPVQAHFDLLVNFEFDSDKLTDAAKQNLRRVRQSFAGPAA